MVLPRSVPYRSGVLAISVHEREIRIDGRHEYSAPVPPVMYNCDHPDTSPLSSGSSFSPVEVKAQQKHMPRFQVQSESAPRPG